jgi:hypothetical protein
VAVLETSLHGFPTLSDVLENVDPFTKWQESLRMTLSAWISLTLSAWISLTETL